MSYYFSFPYQFTSHGLSRCRERLKLGIIDDVLVKEKVIDLINKSKFQFETKNTLYIESGFQANLFFVINKVDNTIITCTPISIEKQMNLTFSDD